jgi:hypothetical protein
MRPFANDERDGFYAVLIRINSFLTLIFSEWTMVVKVTS